MIISVGTLFHLLQPTKCSWNDKDEEVSRPVLVFATHSMTLFDRTLVLCDVFGNCTIGYILRESTVVSWSANGAIRWSMRVIHQQSEVMYNTFALGWLVQNIAHCTNVFVTCGGHVQYVGGQKCRAKPS